MKSDQKRGIVCTMYIIYRSNHWRGCYNINTSCRATILRAHTIILSCKKHTSIYIIIVNPMFDAPHVYYVIFFFLKKDPNIDTRFIYAARITSVYYEHYTATVVFVYLESGWKKK